MKSQRFAAEASLQTSTLWRGLACSPISPCISQSMLQRPPSLLTDMLCICKETDLRMSSEKCTNQFILILLGTLRNSEPQNHKRVSCANAFIDMRILDTTAVIQRRASTTTSTTLCSPVSPACGASQQKFCTCADH